MAFELLKSQTAKLHEEEGMEPRRVVEWLLTLLRANNSKELGRNLDNWPEMEAGLKKALEQAIANSLGWLENAQNFFLAKRRLLELTLEIITRRAASERESAVVWLRDLTKRAINIDLAQFVEGLSSAGTELEVQKALLLAPDDFQKEMRSFWKATEMAFGEDADKFREDSIQEAKAIIRRAVGEAPSPGRNFQRWLEDIPLLPCELVDALVLNYDACGITYANFEDQYSGWNEESFFKDARGKIHEWLKTIN